MSNQDEIGMRIEWAIKEHERLMHTELPRPKKRTWSYIRGDKNGDYDFIIDNLQSQNAQLKKALEEIMGDKVEETELGNRQVFFCDGCINKVNMAKKALRRDSDVAQNK